MTASVVVLHTFPHDDMAFRAHVEAAQARVGDGLRPQIEAEIRAAYPAAVVRPAELLAQGEPGVVTWYAYREGHFEPASPDGDWWHEPLLARTVVSADGDYLEANQAAADLFGVTREQIVGTRAGSFTRHDNKDAVTRRVLAVLAAAGALHSTATVVRPDGEEFQMEYSTVAETPGQYVTVMRRLPELPAPQS